jgi:hypothetical protein
MSVSPDVQNNSIVKAIALEPVFQFNDPTNAATNKIAVQNRVKKMSQAERKELMIELDHVIGNVNGVANVPPLKERGLCALLLSDDGKVQSKSFFIVSFVCGFLNLIHARTSSAAVIKKLEHTKSVLDGKAIVPSSLLNVQDQLNAEILRLKTEIDAQAPAEKNVRDLIKEIKEIRSEALGNLSKAEWNNNLSLFVEIELKFGGLTQNAEGKVSDETKRMLNDSIKEFEDLINSTNQFKGSLDQIKWDIIGRISIGLRKLEVGLEDHISSIQAKKGKLQKSQKLVKKRLSEFEKKNQEASERKVINDSTANIKNASKQIQILDQISEVIKTLNKNSGSFFALAKATQSINSRLKASSDEIKNVENFAENFALLAQFAANDATLDKQRLADVIDLSVLATNSSQAELHTRLANFKSNPTLNFPNTDEEKKQLINDYVAYWNVLFTGLREGQKQILEAEKAKTPPKKAPEPVQPQVAPQASAPVAPSVPGVVLPPMIPIPERGHPKLITIATALQNARESDRIDYTYYQQVKTANVGTEIAEKVYRNFYNIMRGLRHLGSVNTDGHSSDPNWGENVFTTGLSPGQAPPGVPRPLLNHYRVQAIVQAINENT